MRWNRSAKTSRRNRDVRSSRRRVTRTLRLESAEARCLMAADGLETVSVPAAAPAAQTETEISWTMGGLALDAEIGQTQSQRRSADPVLMVISNQDFWYQEYADTRAALEAQGLEIVVAATTTEVARPQAGSGQGADGGFVRPDLALSDVEAEDYSGIVFSGGWGMAQYQYGFEGTYDNAAYHGDTNTKQLVNDLIGEFVRQDKHVAAVCYGVSVLAYAEVDGRSLLQGRTVTGWNGQAPGADLPTSSRSQITSNGANLLESRSIGDASTSTDDVFIDGRIITAENFDSATMFGEIVAKEIIAASQNPDSGVEESARTQPKPMSTVIANQDFYHREYYEARESLEAAGLEVVVAAATTETATPHVISVVEGREPDVARAPAL